MPRILQKPACQGCKDEWGHPSTVHKIITNQTDVLASTSEVGIQN